MLKKFISINPMRSELLELLKDKFNTTSYTLADKINIEIDLRKIIDDKLKETQVPEPIVTISSETYIKMNYLIEQYTTEVAWHFLVETHPNNIYVISDVLIFPQNVTSVTANGTDNEYEVWIASQPDEVFDKLRGHGHSHVNMGVTPSGVDENYYADLMTHVKDFYITLIRNKSGANHIRFYDVKNNIVFVDVPLHIIFESGETLENWLAPQRALVKAPVVTATTTTYSGGTTITKYKDKEDYGEWYYKDEIVAGGLELSKDEVYIEDYAATRKLYANLKAAAYGISNAISTSFKKVQNNSPKLIEKELDNNGIIFYDPKKNKILFNLNVNEVNTYSYRTDLYSWEVLI